MKDYYLNPSHKKIRGWRRRVKRVEAWGAMILQPHTGMFEDRGYTYESCTLSPFCRFIKRRPPLWFYKIIIEKFFLAYHQWQIAFDALGKPYDLMLWIYDPRFPNSEIIRSEVYCREVDAWGDKVGAHWEIEDDRPFPGHLLDGPFFDSRQFTWVVMPEENIVEEFDIEEDGWTIAELTKAGYRQKTRSSGSLYYAKQIGDIWVGRSQ